MNNSVAHKYAVENDCAKSPNTESSNELGFRSSIGQTRFSAKNRAKYLYRTTRRRSCSKGTCYDRRMHTRFPGTPYARGSITQR